MFNISSIRKKTVKGNVKRLNKVIRDIKNRIKICAYHGRNYCSFDGYYVCETKDEIEVIANYFISKGFTINYRNDWSFDINW